MALFKIFKGNSANLETNRPTRQEGFIYLTEDDMKFYVDVDSTHRKPLNASKADMLQTWYTDPKDQAGKWTAIIPGITADNLVDGLTIRIRLSTSYFTNGQGYNTLNINGLGPKLVYFRYNQLLINQIPRWAEIILTYHNAHTMTSSVDNTTQSIPGCRPSAYTPDSGFYVNTDLGTDGWILDPSFSDGNNYDRLWNAYEERTAASTVFTGTLCMIDANGKIHSIVTTGSNGANKVADTTPFVPSRIMYYAGFDNVTSGNKVKDLYEDVPISDMSYSLNSAMTGYSDLYLKGSLTSTGLFVLDQSDYYVIVPHSIAIPANTFTKGKYYMYVGASDSNSGHLQLLPSHPFFYCADNAGRVLQPSCPAQDDIVVGRISGVLPIAKGGSGLAASPSMLIALDSNNPDDVFKATPTPGVSGVLATHNGGTGNSAFTQYHLTWSETATKIASTPYMYLDYSAGDADTEGYESLVLGNSLAAGTNLNAFGRLALYSKDVSGSYIIAADSDEWKNHVLPAANGWLVTGGNGSDTGVGGAYWPVYVNNSGVATICNQPSLLVDLASANPANVFVATPQPGVSGILPSNHGGTGVDTHVANRLVWSTSATTIKADKHYANATKVAINYTSEPDYNFYVNGSVGINGSTYIKTAAPKLYIWDTSTDTDTYAYLAFGNSSNANAGVMFLNGPDRTNEGGANLMTIRNNVGNIRLNNNVLNTGRLTVGQDTFDTTYKFYVNGISYFNGNVTHNGIIYLANGTTYYIDNSAVGYFNDLRSDQTRLVDNWLGFYSAANAGGNRYGYIQCTQNVMSFRKENQQTGVTAQFDFNGIVQPSAHNTYDLGTTSLRWKNLYLQGNLVMQDAGTPSSYPYTANKITWTGGTDGASIYYKVASADAGRLVFNTTDDANCLISLAYNDTDKAYFATSTPSFYPATTNTGSLGLATNRWSALYLGTADSYGAYGLPVYWNAGVPLATYPIQYTTWSIASGGTSVTLTKSGQYFADTFVIALVVTSGEANLNGPITWTSAANTLTLTTSAATSGAVSGYVITARGAAI